MHTTRHNPRKPPNTTLSITAVLAELLSVNSVPSVTLSIEYKINTYVILSALLIVILFGIILLMIFILLVVEVMLLTMLL